MTASTAAARAAAARLRRRATPARALIKDPCPQCGAELGQPHGATRRLVVFTSRRGVFGWQCPECRAVWDEQASTQVGSTTRSGTGLRAPQA